MTVLKLGAADLDDSAAIADERLRSGFYSRISETLLIHEHLSRPPSNGCRIKISVLLYRQAGLNQAGIWSPGASAGQGNSACFSGWRTTPAGWRDSTQDACASQSLSGWLGRWRDRCSRLRRSAAGYAICRKRRDQPFRETSV